MSQAWLCLPLGMWGWTHLTTFAHPEKKEAEFNRLRGVRGPPGTTPMFLKAVIPTFCRNENTTRPVSFLQL